MYPSFSEQTFKPRRRRKARKSRTPRWQPLPPLEISYFQSHDEAFFDANLDRTYFARRVDDEEIAAFLRERHGRATLGYRFAPWFSAPNEWPWTWFLACKIDRAEGVISRRYVASGCDDYTNYSISRLCGAGPLEAAGEIIAALLWEAAPKSARYHPYMQEDRYYRIPAHLQEGSRS